MHVHRTRFDGVVVPHTRSSRRSRESTRFRFSTRHRRSSNSRRVSRIDLAIDRNRDRVEIRDEMLSAIDGHGRLVAPLSDGGVKRRADARRELAQAERLGDVVVGAEVQPGHPIGLARARGEHDDRHARRGRTSAQDPADLDSTQDRAD